jgi:hypothetical protein
MAEPASPRSNRNRAGGSVVQPFPPPAALCLMRGSATAGSALMVRFAGGREQTAARREATGSMMPKPQAESHWRVSVPMYNLPEMQAVNAAFWEAIRRGAAAAGGD